MNARIINEEHQARADEAYRRLKPELIALEVAELKQLNISAARTVQRVVAALPRLRSLRQELSEVLPTFDQSLFDKLEDCALVLAVAQDRYEVALPDYGDGLRLLEQAMKLRETLRLDAAALCKRGILKPRRLSKLKKLRGYEATAHDLALLASVLRRLLPIIQGRSAVTIGDLDQAAELSGRLLAEHKLRDERRPSPEHEERARAFTLLFKTYVTVRRAIGYLRGEKADADLLMPPLGGSQRRRAAI